MREIKSLSLDKKDIERILAYHFKAEKAEVKAEVTIIGYEHQMEGGGAIYGQPIVTALVIGVE
jgi:hypothetical protein